MRYDGSQSCPVTPNSKPAAGWYAACPLCAKCFPAPSSSVAASAADPTAAAPMADPNTCILSFCYRCCPRASCAPSTFPSSWRKKSVAKWNSTNVSNKSPPPSVVSISVACCVANSKTRGGRKGDGQSLSRHQFEKYLDQVFDFFTRLAALPDGRCYGNHSLPKIFEAVFFGSACQFGPLHRIETECRQGALRRRIGRVSEDAIGYTLERQDPKAIFALGCDIARQLKRNQVLASTWSRGLVVAAVDGIEICSSFVRCWSRCLERTVKYKVGEEQREQIQYYHRISVVSIVSGCFPIPLGIRFQHKGEDEVAS